jgi:hypothetical protein
MVTPPRPSPLFYRAWSKIEVKQLTRPWRVYSRGASGMRGCVNLLKDSKTEEHIQ